MKLKDIGYLNLYVSKISNYKAFSFMDLNFESHRTDGPAYISTTGYKEWHTHGIMIRSNSSET